METTLNLVHYGASSYDSSKFDSIVNSELSSKPEGGLWACPIDTDNTWKDLDHGKDLSDNFQFTFSGELLTIESISDFFGLNWIENVMGQKVLNFEKLSASYDAIYMDNAIVEQALELLDSSNINLYGWDCTCVVILNPSTITV